MRFTMRLMLQKNTVVLTTKNDNTLNNIFHENKTIFYNKYSRNVHCAWILREMEFRCEIHVARVFKITV